MDIRVTGAQIAAFARAGAVLVEGLFADRVETLRAGVTHNVARRGPAG